MTDPNIPESLVEVGAIRLLFEDCGDTSLWETMDEAEKQNFMDQSRAVLTAAWDALHPVVTTEAGLEELPNESVIKDAWGDVGVKSLGRLHYPETTALAVPYVAKRFLPATVLHRGGDAL